MKKAFSMIELVISIVVMGMAMMTLPLMLTRIQENSSFAMQQEAILMARTRIGNIITYPWDEHSTDSSFNVAVLDTDSLNYKRIDSNNARRLGHVEQDKRRKFFTDETNATTIGEDELNEIPDDIDDFDDKNGTLQGDKYSAFGYKTSEGNMNISASVKYISDTPATPFNFDTTGISGTGTTNIKMIQIDLNNSLLDGNITLRAFSSNIGANQLLRRTFP